MAGVGDVVPLSQRRKEVAADGSVRENVFFFIFSLWVLAKPGSDVDNCDDFGERQYPNFLI